ncbi:AAA family ATPase [Variovorax brevis]|uniref:AAA family ATPase n=1 Tax=Variovorax brevis TaxID=3053503 RepID=UPI003365A0AB
MHNILLQLFDEGRLTTARAAWSTSPITIIIATSNLGSEVIQRNLKAKDREVLAYPALRDRLMELPRHHFRPEFLNRVDEVVVFHALGKPEIHAIVGLQLQHVARTAAAQNVQLKLELSRWRWHKLAGCKRRSRCITVIGFLRW